MKRCLIGFVVECDFDVVIVEEIFGEGDDEWSGVGEWEEVEGELGDFRGVVFVEIV